MINFLIFTGAIVVLSIIILVIKSLFESLILSCYEKKTKRLYLKNKCNQLESDFLVFKTDYNMFKSDIRDLINKQNKLIEQNLKLISKKIKD